CRMVMTGTSPMSAAVITASRPGCARAALTSIERMRPCATGLRRITACRTRASDISSTNWPRPRRKRRSSSRSTGLPIRALGAAAHDPPAAFSSWEPDFEGALIHAPLYALAFAQRNIAHGAGRKQFLDGEAAVAQPVLLGILQECLDGRTILLDAVGEPIRPD